ncbi:uncharacterized protein LOC143026909 [Oratosquilla oratoria]|uniref:uncharacterized protein LOC143026909 n=1 Tax=Oratosquilla oratoria TaxID=337810 RepID=UPI003F771703
MAWSHPCVWLLRLTGLLAVTCTSTLSRPTDGDVVDESNLLLGSGLPLKVLPLAQTLQQEVNKQTFDTEDGEKEGPFNGITDSGTYRKELVVDVPIATLIRSLSPKSAYSNRGYISESGRGSHIGRISWPLSWLSLDGLSHLHGRQWLMDFPLHSLKQNLQDRYWDSLPSGMDAYSLPSVYDAACRRKLLCLMQSTIETPSAQQLPVSELRKSRRIERTPTWSNAVVKFLPRREMAPSSSSAKSSSLSCAEKNPSCPVSFSDVIHLQVLPLWKDLAKYVPKSLSVE